MPKFFFVLFVILFGATWGALFDSFRAYRAEATILVFSKSASVSAETVAMNLSELVRTTSFYDRLLADNETISDPWEGDADSDRRESWGDVLKAQVPSGTSILRLSISSPERAQSSALLSASLETLYGFSGRLYHREREANVRLVDPMSVHPEIAHPVALFLVSALLSGGLAFLISLLMQISLPSIGGWALPRFPRLNRTIFSRQASSLLRPVGSFPDLPPEAPSSSREMEEERIRSSQPIPDASSDEATFSGGSGERDTPSEVPNTSETSPKSDPDEPDDIWEKSRSLSRGEFRIQSSIPQGEKAEDDSRLRDASPASPVSSERVAAFKEHVSRDRLQSVPASEFSWEKYLFEEKETASHGADDAASNADWNRKQNDASKSPTSQETGVSISDSVSSREARREPTPEELKARLNELLRGEG